MDATDYEYPEPTKWLKRLTQDYEGGTARAVRWIAEHTPHRTGDRTYGAIGSALEDCPPDVLPDLENLHQSLANLKVEEQAVIALRLALASAWAIH